MDRECLAGFGCKLKYALACNFDLPIVLLCIGIVFTERGEPLICGLENLAYQIFCESHIIPADRQQRQQVFRIDGAKEIEI